MHYCIGFRLHREIDRFCATHDRIGQAPDGTGDFRGCGGDYAHGKAPCDRGA